MGQGSLIQQPAAAPAVEFTMVLASNRARSGLGVPGLEGECDAPTISSTSGSVLTPDGVTKEIVLEVTLKA